jgi:hypothetical protein
LPTGTSTGSFSTLLLNAYLVYATTPSRAVSENDLFGRELSEAETIVFARDMEKLFTRMTQEDESQELTRRHIHLPKFLTNIFEKISKHVP